MTCTCTCTCTCESIAFARVGDTILCCRCKQPVSLRPAVSSGVCNTVSGAAVSDKLVELEYERRNHETRDW